MTARISLMLGKTLGHRTAPTDASSPSFDIGEVDATSRRSREASFSGAAGEVERGAQPLLKNPFRNTSAIPTSANTSRHGSSVGLVAQNGLGGLLRKKSLLSLGRKGSVNRFPNPTLVLPISHAGI
jgi:hypothetical protein